MAQFSPLGKHIDVAPRYGDAELRLKPWRQGIRDRVFLGEKTGQRTRAAARAELSRSLVPVTMAIKNCEFFEVLLPAAAPKSGLVEDIEVDWHGLVHAMTGPGLGARMDFDLIGRQKTAVLAVLRERPAASATDP